MGFPQSRPRARLADGSVMAKKMDRSYRVSLSVLFHDCLQTSLPFSKSLDGASWLRPLTVLIEYAKKKKHTFK